VRRKSSLKSIDSNIVQANKTRFDEIARVFLFFRNERDEAVKTILWNLTWLILFFAAFVIIVFAAFTPLEV